MLTGTIRNKVDKIWLDIFAGGIANPITVIEQLTYLMFIHDLDEMEIKNESFEAVSGEKMPRAFPQNEAGQQMRWSRFKHQDARVMYDMVANRVFPFIKALNGGGDESAFSRYMRDAMFLFPEGNKALLQKVVTGLDELYEHDLKDRDLRGDLYEYMLGKLSVSGQNGQFRTPKHIRDMMVRLVQPGPRDLICDPACGCGASIWGTNGLLEDRSMSPRYSRMPNPILAHADLILAHATREGVAFFANSCCDERPRRQK